MAYELPHASLNAQNFHEILGFVFEAAVAVDGDALTWKTVREKTALNQLQDDELKAQYPHFATMLKLINPMFTILIAMGYATATDDKGKKITITPAGQDWYVTYKYDEQAAIVHFAEQFMQRVWFAEVGLVAPQDYEAFVRQHVDNPDDNELETSYGLLQLFGELASSSVSSVGTQASAMPSTIDDELSNLDDESPLPDDTLPSAEPDWLQSRESEQGRVQYIVDPTEPAYDDDNDITQQHPLSNMPSSDADEVDYEQALQNFFGDDDDDETWALESDDEDEPNAYDASHFADTVAISHGHFSDDTIRDGQTSFDNDLMTQDDNTLMDETQPSAAPDIYGDVSSMDSTVASCYEVDTEQVSPDLTSEDEDHTLVNRRLDPQPQAIYSPFDPPARQPDDNDVASADNSAGRSPSVDAEFDPFAPSSNADDYNLPLSDASGDDDYNLSPFDPPSTPNAEVRQSSTAVDITESETGDIGMRSDSSTSYYTESDAYEMSPFDELSSDGSSSVEDDYDLSPFDKPFDSGDGAGELPTTATDIPSQSQSEPEPPSITPPKSVPAARQHTPPSSLSEGTRLQATDDDDDVSNIPSDASPMSRFRRAKQQDNQAATPKKLDFDPNEAMRRSRGETAHAAESDLPPSVGSVGQPAQQPPPNKGTKSGSDDDLPPKNPFNRMQRKQQQAQGSDTSTTSGSGGQSSSKRREDDELPSMNPLNRMQRKQQQQAKDDDLPTGNPLDALRRSGKSGNKALGGSPLDSLRRQNRPDLPSSSSSNLTTQPMDDGVIYEKPDGSRIKITNQQIERLMQEHNINRNEAIDALISRLLNKGD